MTETVEIVSLEVTAYLVEVELQLHGRPDLIS